MSKNKASMVMALSDALWEAAVVIKVRSADVKKWPNDEEALHQYRISIRVARSLAKFMKPYQKRVQNQRLQTVLKQLQDPTSRMREMDVLVETIPSDSPIYEACVAAKERTRTAFTEQFLLEETQNALAEVQYVLKHVAWKRSVLLKGLSQKALTKRVAAEQTALEKALVAVDFDDQEAVHDLRKSAKRLRYVARELGEALPEDAGAVSGRMKEVQDLLGEWCDARVNAALVREICGEAGESVALEFQAAADAIVDGLRQSREQA